MNTRMQREELIIRKDSATIVSERYKTAKTIPLIFHFDPFPYTSTRLRLPNSSIQHASVDGKDLYLFDHFFTEEESAELRTFSAQARFGRKIYAQHASNQSGEEPARAMDKQEKWKCFSHPPQAMSELFKFLGFLAEELEAQVTTLPWELYDNEICAPAFATNFITQLSSKSEELGKHRDYDPEQGLAFGIPVLYEQGSSVHPQAFTNGEAGRPWLVTLMAYATSERFLPEYGMGSVFCKSDGEAAYRIGCEHMRFILFEGDLLHGVAQSTIPRDVEVWRVSYVFKLIFNPQKSDESVKKKFCEFIEVTCKNER